MSCISLINSEVKSLNAYNDVSSNLAKSSTVNKPLSNFLSNSAL